MKNIYELPQPPCFPTTLLHQANDTFCKSRNSSQEHRKVKAKFVDSFLKHLLLKHTSESVTLPGKCKNAKVKLRPSVLWGLLLLLIKALRHFRKQVSQNIPRPVSCNLLTTQPGYVVITAAPGSAIK